MNKKDFNIEDLDIWIEEITIKFVPSRFRAF